MTVLGVTRTATTTVLYVPTPNETWWAIWNPLKAIKANSLASEASQWASDNAEALGGGLHNGRADAARHAYWNVLMTVEMDAATAEGAATAHERTNVEEGGAHNEIVMDMENNLHGRTIAGGLPPNPSRTDCQSAYWAETPLATVRIEIALQSRPTSLSCFRCLINVYSFRSYIIDE